MKISPFSPYRVVIAYIFLFVISQSSGKIVLTPESGIVANRLDERADNDGPPENSTITFPCAICAFGNPVTTDTLVIGSFSKFRLLNRTNYLSTWFGKYTREGDPIKTDGRINDVTVRSPYGCASFDQAPSEKHSIIYYVTGDNYVRWVDKDFVLSQSVRDSASLVAMAIDNDHLFMIDSTKDCMFKCIISSDNLIPRDCIVLANESFSTELDFRRISIVANDNGIFVSFGGKINWYNSTGGLINSRNELPINALAYDSYSNTLWATTSSAVYNMSVNEENHIMDLDLFAGVESWGSEDCESKDGVNPTFCGISHLYVKNPNEIFLLFPALNTVREVMLVPRVVTILFERKPFPIGMIGIGAELNELYALLDNSINSKLETNDTRVNRTSVVVFSNWTTKIDLLIDQRDFDDEKTESNVQKMDFPEVMNVLDMYYNKTNQLVYSDTMLLPVCNSTIMDTIEHTIANHTREVLKYNLIYTDRFQILPSEDTRNIIVAKLLMPASFENRTTQVLLSNAHFSEIILKFMGDTYPTNHKYTVKLPMQFYRFDKLSPLQEQQARVKISDILGTRLRECISQMYHLNANSPAINPLQLSCKPRIGISNRTLVPDFSHPSGINKFQTFIPTSFDYDFDIMKCLDESDWDDLKYWITNTTIFVYPNQCSAQCIVGIAVGAAIFVALITMFTVVQVSKRKRLATVLVPEALEIDNQKK